jgi:hypothetical protein
MEQVVPKATDKTYPTTFRLPVTLLGELKKESGSARVSLNTLVKQILDRYVLWERHSGKLGLIPLTRPFIAETVKSLSDERIRHIAYNGSKNALKELILLARGDLTLDSFTSVFNEWLKASCMAYRYEFDGEKHRYVIHHDLGKKWSLYLSDLLTAVCKDLTQVNPKIVVRKRSLSVEFH